MIRHIALAAVVGLIAWLGPFGIVCAETAAVELDTVISQLEKGDPGAAKGTLQSLRRQRFPGRSFSGTTCRNEPAFALMAAAERKMAVRDGVMADNYLQQLSCLQRADEASAAEKRSLSLLRGYRDLIPERVNECPFPLGDAALARGIQAIEDRRFVEAWGELLTAACLAGQGDPGFIEAHRHLQNIVRGHAGEPETSGVTPEPQPEPVATPDRPSAVLLPQPVEIPHVGQPRRRPGVREGAETPLTTDVASSPNSELIAGQTSPGQISFNPPESMQTGQSEIIEVRIQPESVLTEGMLGSGDIQVEAIGVTPSMSVKLCCGPPEGDSPFDIISLSNEQQVVSPGTFTQWIFEVTPRKQGPQSLTLSVSAQYRFPNGEVIPKNYPVMTRSIQVRVSEQGTLLIWLSLGATVMVVLLLWTWLRRSRGTARIFVSYRRDDTGGWVRGLHDRLAEHFGEQVVFMDLNDIVPGADFVSTLNKSLKETRVVLVVIGRRWMEAQASTGQRRLDDPADWVRLEVQKAIEGGKYVIPVLVDGAEMPDTKDLPEDIQALVRYQAVKIYPDQFSSGVQMLIQAIDLASERK